MGNGLILPGDDWGEPTVRVDQNGVTWVEYKATANLASSVTISYGSTNGTSWFLHGPGGDNVIEIVEDLPEKTDLDGALDWFLENR